jgi:hypothetical protein
MLLAVFATATPVYEPKATPVDDTVQVLATVAVTGKVPVAVAAKAELDITRSPLSARVKLAN